MDLISPEEVVKSLIDRLQTIYHDDNLKISYIDNKSKEVVIIFSHARYLPNDGREMLGGYINKDKNVIHIVDIKCSWFNNFTPEFVLSKISYLVLGKIVYLVGASMGGFNAVIFSNYIDSKICIAFGPQYSIIDEISPHSDLTGPRINSIQNIKIDRMSFSKKTKYLFIFGNSYDEKQNYNKIFTECKINKIDAKGFIFKDAGHEVLPYIAKNFNGASLNIEKMIKLNIYDLFNEYKNFNILFIPNISKINNFIY